MSWLSSIAVGLIVAVFGLFVAALVANATVSWYGLAGLEIGAGYFVIFNVLFGGLTAFVIGLITCRALDAWGKPTVVRASIISALVIALIGGATAVTAWLLADIPPEIQGYKLNLEVEIRLPATDTTPPAEISNSSFMLASVVDRVPRVKRNGQLKVLDARQEDGRWIIPATVFLFTTRGGRQIEAQLGGETIASFPVPLPARPGLESEQWSEWWPRLPGAPSDPPSSAPDGKAGGADKGSSAGKKGKPPPPPPPSFAPSKTAAPAKAAAVKPPPVDNPSFRYRVVRIGGVGGERPPLAEESQARQAASEKAAFESMLPDAPVADWFPYTRFGAPEEYRTVAIRNILARPNYVEEVSSLMLSQENQKAAEALYLAAKLPAPQRFAAAISAAGKDIAARLDKLNAKPLDQDTAYIAAADISVRFAAWIEAARTVRRSGDGDFVPGLLAILERSRINTDNALIQQEVRRPASYYAKQWAGIAPLPDDPPR